MSEENNTKEYNIDVAGKKLGRVATEIAVVLIGKDSPNFSKNVVPDVIVNVTNVDDLEITDKKLTQTEYQRYSGYPGGRKVFNMSDIVTKHGKAEVLRKAVYGMMPVNKLRNIRMKKLIIK